MTTGSILWQKLRRLFQAELRDEYAKMRLKSFSVDNFMKYLYGTQVSQIPEINYNKDAQTKYLDFGPAYLFACHGNRYQHMKKWIRERILYLDTLMGYTGSTSDFITIRANKLGNVSLWLETYIPMYLTVKWRDVPDEVVGGVVTNPGKTIKRVGRNQKVKFDGYLNTATDQNVVIYAGRYLKSIDGLSALRPGALLMASATKLTNLECHSDLLIESSVSDMVNLQYIDFNGCKVFGDANATEAGQKLLDLTKCKYIKKVDISGTSLTALDINITGGSIEELIYPTGVQSVVLSNQPRLEYVGLPQGYRSIIRNSKPLSGAKYSYTIKSNINNPVITSSSSNLTFKDPISVINGQAYKIKMNKPGGIVTVNEFNILDELINVSTINMQSESISEYISNADTIKVIVVMDSLNIWNESEMKNCRIAIEKDIEIFDECTALQTFNLNNCENISRLSQYPYPETTNKFESLKHVQNFTLNNSLKISDIDIGKFSNLRKLELSGLKDLSKVTFNNMNNLNDSGKLKDVIISNCPKITKIEMNVTSEDKSVIFANDALIDVSSLYTLKKIESNTPIIGLKTLTLSRDIEDIIFSNRFASHNWDSSIRNIWSYSSSSENQEEGFEGIDFKDLKVKNLDMTTAKKIVETKNFNVSPVDTFIVNQVRDNVLYPYMKLNGIIDLTDYTGSYVELFKNANLDNTTIICNKDITATNFSGLFEGAIIGKCDLTQLLLRIKNAKNCSRMFANSDIRSFEAVELITTGSGLNANYMFEGCRIDDGSQYNIPAGTISIKGMFKNVTTITESPIVTIPNTVNDISELYDGCLKLRSINYMKFGSGITNSINWEPINVESANNIVIMASSISFGRCKLLSSAANVLVTSTCKSLENLFNGCSSLSEFSLNNSSITTNITSLKKSFSGCVSLTSFDFTNLNTTSVIDFSSTFEGCGLISVDISNLTLKNPADINSMFKDNKSLMEANISNIKVRNASYLFSGCTNLSVVTIDNANFRLCYTTNSMFRSCESLGPDIDLSILDFENLTDARFMFNSCTSIMTIKLPAIPNECSFQASFMSCTNVGSIEFGGVINASDLVATFDGCEALSSLLYESIITSSLTEMYRTFNRCSSLELIPFLDTYNTSNIINMSNLFSNCYLLKQETFDLITNWDTTNVENAKSMFEGCSSALSFDLSNWNLSSCRVMDLMFSSCSSVETINLTGLDLSKCVSITKIFSDCVNLKNIIGISLLRFGKITDFDSMFNNTTKLEHEIDLSFISKSYGVNIYSLFNRSSVPNVIGLENLKLIGNASQAFQLTSNLTMLDLSTLDMSNVSAISESWSAFVYENKSLQDLDISNWDLSKCTHMEYFGMNNNKLKTLIAKNMNLSTIKSTYRWFESCKLLETVDFSGTDVGNIPDLSGYNAPFRACTALTDFKPFENIRCNLTLDTNIYLSVESIVSVIHNLVDVSEARSLIIGKSNLDKLTPQQIAVATAKGWSIS